MATFCEQFKAATGNEPFPWQCELYKRMMAGDWPKSCAIPTGLGKTSVVAVWLVALANHPDKIPRRLVYVVNRRTVVDQTTSEAERIRKRLQSPELAEFANRLGTLCAIPRNDDQPPLAISTLRGQFADNRQWSADPARPAVIVGTVDMIGSRLLFSGYGVGFKSKPLHAGFLGQDALLVHDEAHLEPAFQELIETIEREQLRCKDFCPCRVMQLTATARSGKGTTDQDDVTLGLTPEEANPPYELPDQPTDPIHHVWRRMKATKQLRLVRASDNAKIIDKIADLALDEQHKASSAAVLVFVHTPEEVKQVCDKLKDTKKGGVGEDHVQPLTGTMRGLERDRMADPRRPDASRVFARFLKQPNPDAPENEQWKTEPMPGTVYLVCTSAGEVGIDISADHMVCDLSTFESMAQRFGRVNRYGDRADTRIDVVHSDEAAFDPKDKLTPARQETLKLLRQLTGDASPKNLSDFMAKLDEETRKKAFAPKPAILPATDILFDAWALTSIKGKLPGRPPVEPYLHGISGWEPPETHVLWRADVQYLAKALESDSIDAEELEELFDAYDIQPREQLRDATTRKRPRRGVTEKLEDLANKTQGEAENARSVGDMWSIVIDSNGRPVPKTIRDIAEMNLANCTIVLPVEAGGLSASGTFDPSLPTASDVADESPPPTADSKAQVAPSSARLRVLLRGSAEGWRAEYLAAPTDRTPPQLPPGHVESRRALATIVLNKTGLCCEHEIEVDVDDEGEAKVVLLYLLDPKSPGALSAARQTLVDHTDAIVLAAERIAKALDLNETLRAALVLAARCHDLGKDRKRWQRYACNSDLREPLAKSPKYLHWRHLAGYRHEFGSLLDVLHGRNGSPPPKEFADLSEEMQELVLHLIAVHHGFGRPHFPADNAFDPEHSQSNAETIAAEVPRRFARLQRKYGRWGLAFLESLLRAADWAASANPSKFVDEQEDQP